jgi:hypothetical protein
MLPTIPIDTMTDPVFIDRLTTCPLDHTSTQIPIHHIHLLATVINKICMHAMSTVHASSDNYITQLHIEVLIIRGQPYAMY